jgi:iron complex transport system substrate-binding protein
LKIISLLPSATEIVFALGLGDSLEGVTHECDHPPEATQKPIVSRPSLPPGPLSSREIDDAVREKMNAKEPL